MYHRVLKDNDKAILSMQPGMYVTESVFKKQMIFLARYYQLISLKELLELWGNGGYSKDERYCIVTFDDGWLDNYLNAYPVLKKHGIPATIFVTTSFIGTNRWYWPEKLSFLLLNKYQDMLGLSNSVDDIRDDIVSSIFTSVNESCDCAKSEQIDFVIEALKKYSDQSIEHAIEKIYELLNISVPEERAVLNWDEINEMSNNGISFGSHTCNHKILTTIPLNEVREELKNSKRLLETKNINFIPVFCYPNGNRNQEIEKIVRESGYEAAVTTRFGFENEKPDDYFGIKRIGIHNDISSTMPLFSFHLSGLRQRL
jgi:peptidoglycan/xylan/chitin deacetylase (PgdA/CDA1 family)